MTPRRGLKADLRLDRHSSRFSEDLRQVLRTELLKRPCTATEIARLFSMNRRTMCRHLAHEGVSFQQVVNEIRFSIACDLLANTGIAANQVSAILKFSEPSAFTRAFQRWSGQTPSAWRASHARTRKLPMR
jgi:AraC-like DNA-binding protein